MPNYNDRNVVHVYAGELSSFLRENGYDSVASFLNLFPGIPLAELSKRFPGSGLSPAGIIRAQMREAVRAGRIREAAMDALVREINGQFENGWRIGKDPDFTVITIWSFWSMTVEKETERAELGKESKSVWGALLAQNPAVGWRPASPADSLIQQAFSEGWPEPTTE